MSDKKLPAQRKAQSVALAQTGFMPTNLDEVWRLAGAVARVMEPTGNPAEIEQATSKALIKMTTGMEHGLTPMHATRAMHVIATREGVTVSLSSQAKRALVMASPKCGLFTVDVSGEGDSLVAVAKGVRIDKVDGRSVTSTLTRTARFVDFKKIMQGKNGLKTNWKNYPARMLVARASGWLADDLWPDVVSGLRSNEEIEDWPEREVRDIPPDTGAATLAQHVAQQQPAQQIEQQQEEATAAEEAEPAEAVEAADAEVVEPAVKFNPDTGEIEDADAEATAAVAAADQSPAPSEEETENRSAPSRGEPETNQRSMLPEGEQQASGAGENPWGNLVE